MKKLAAEFFRDENGFKRPSRSTTWYNAGVYYSYATAVAGVFTRKNGEKIAVISANNFSNTSARHISDLKNACPFTVIRAFFRYRGDGSPVELFETNRRYLETAAASRLTQKANREKFRLAFRALEEFLELKQFEKFQNEVKKIVKKFRPTMEGLKK